MFKSALKHNAVTTAGGFYEMNRASVNYMTFTVCLIISELDFNQMLRGSPI